METIDRLIRTELERLSPPADPSGVVDRILRRGARRHAARRVGTVLLAITVISGSIGAFFALTQVFRRGEEPPPVTTPPAVSNGLIVFSLPLEGGGEGLMAVAPDGTGLRRLTPEGRANYRSPDVSPDGTTVVAVHEIPSFEPGQTVLVTIPIEGGSPTWITTERDQMLDPTWSPDGTRIAFVAAAGSQVSRYGISVLDVATGRIRRVPGTEDINVGSPSWSSDGRSLVFEGATDPDADATPTWDVYSMGVDGSGLTNLTNTPAESETSPSWSWATDRIAFVRDPDSLYTMSVDGTDERFVTGARPPVWSPTWSPDGTSIAYSTGTGQVYVVRPDGTGTQAVADAMGEVAWQAVPEGATVPPVPTPSPSEPLPSADEIGLGFPVCNVSSLRAPFAMPGEDAVVFVATRTGDTGGCPEPGNAFNVVAIDLDADGLADASYGPIECELDCRTFSAPDLDADGTAELLIVQSGGSVLGLRLFDVELSDGGPIIEPVTIAPPGDPAGGFEAGAAVHLLLGGDEWYLSALTCGDPEMRDGPGLVVTAAESLPHDSPDARWHAHRTVFALVDGSLRVMDVGDFTERAGFDPPSFASEETLCGSNLGP